MSVRILMPALSPTMTEGKLAKWHVKEGDAVTSGDVIAEIETDKATMEVEAIDDGKIGKILVAEGTDGVAVNDTIAILLEEGEDESTIEEALNDNSPITAVADSKKQEESTKKEIKEPKLTQITNNSSAQKGDRIIVTPLARRIAENRGIDLTKIKGSGPNGRIVKADIEKISTNNTAMSTAITTNTRIEATNSPDAIELAKMLNMPHHLEENSSMRKTIASRLLEAKQTVPHYYLTIDCELDKLLIVRKEINDSADGEYKLSVNDFIVKAAALALKKVPNANVAWSNQATVIYDRVDISVAVAIDGGLITPIVKDTNNKSMKVISAEIKELAQKARNGALKPEEYQGGNFTISNLGMFGVKEFSAIINPPQATILAIGAGEQRPVVKDGKLTIATVMTCTASFDHRAIDGAVGAQFLSAFKKYIENPISMLA